MENKFRSSPLALAVLSLLRVGPLHPYGIQRLIKEWGKDEVVNVGNRANLYKTIKRLPTPGSSPSAKPSGMRSIPNAPSTN